MTRRWGLYGDILKLQSLLDTKSTFTYCVMHRVPCLKLSEVRFRYIACSLLGLFDEPEPFERLHSFPLRRSRQRFWQRRFLNRPLVICVSTFFFFTILAAVSSMFVPNFPSWQVSSQLFQFACKFSGQGVVCCTHWFTWQSMSEYPSSVELPSCRFLLELHGGCPNKRSLGLVVLRFAPVLKRCLSAGPIRVPRR